MDSGMGKHYCRDHLWSVDVCERGQVITASSLMVAWPYTLCSSIINFQYRTKPCDPHNSSHHTPHVISEDIIQALTLHVTHNPCDPPRHYGLSRHHVTSEIGEGAEWTLVWASTIAEIACAWSLGLATEGLREFFSLYGLSTFVKVGRLSLLVC